MSAGLDWDEDTYPYSDPRNDWYQARHSEDSIKFILEKAIITDPGTEFQYTTGLSLMLSSIIHKNTDMHADQFAERYLFEPLGISSYVWHHTDDGLTNTGSGLELCPRDLAKIGYLYINNGIWKTQQILSESWIYESIRAWIQVDDDLHYGFQWWLLPLAGIPDIVPQNNDIYWAAGFYGQTVFAIPTLSMVVVINANEGNNF